jgi:phosphoserine phosphatase
MALAVSRMVDEGRSVVQFGINGSDATAARALIADAFGALDVLVTDHEPQIPSLFVSDMDSTMIGQECIDELADFAGLKPQIAAITERAMRGELDFEAALRERVALLEGLDEGAIARCLEERIRPASGAVALLSGLRDAGCRTVLVTGGFHHFADEVARQLGFDRVVGNRLAIANGRLTGELEGPIADASIKRAVLEEERAALSPGARVMAAGDGANDIPMLRAADYGFAVRAKQAARDAANGSVDYGDLTAIMDLIGHG